MHTPRISIRKSRSGGLLAAIALVTACNLEAQVPTVSGGTHVRLWTRESGGAIKGTVFSQTGDTIRVASKEVVYVVPTASIERMDVGSGRSHGAGALKGAKIGALAMGGFCLVVCGAAYVADSSSQNEAGSLMAFVGLFAYSGAFYGAIIGAIAGSERYATAYSERVSLKIAPTTDGKRQIGLALRF